MRDNFRKRIPHGVVIGPFSQILTMDFQDSGGPLSDQQLPLLENCWIRLEKGAITGLGHLSELLQPHDHPFELETPFVCLPGLIDAHTHLCYAGSRASDFAARISGADYTEIAAAGGGILDTVRKTRYATVDELTQGLVGRVKTTLLQGVTTCEVKTGYGLTYDDEMKMLDAIRKAQAKVPVSLIPTCLAAHTRPPEYKTNKEYLSSLTHRLLKTLVEGNFCHRIDIFVDDLAFSVDEARSYLSIAKQMGFQLVVHADQFTKGGALLAAELGALSADHLEVSGPNEFKAMKKGGVIPVVLPGACLGLGMPFPRCREILEAGLPLAIASDWNPGSAPMGNLLLQASLLAAACKLTTAETIAGITSRAAKALGLKDRGILKPGFRADFLLFPTSDHREILYSQGNLHPSKIYIQGSRVC